MDSGKNLSLSHYKLLYTEKPEMELSPFWSFWFQGIPLLPPLVPHQSPVKPVTNSLPSSQADFQRLPNLALGPSDRPLCRIDLYQSSSFKVEPYDLSLSI